ncbi:F-box domain-containing protein [Mycena venus]|uniref:F-box domain-containing protein n=1 Tax=Mycena venus TaxID=2733690 RepID=A0A8H6XWB4_9AGAR|nr:F-box domain-containing protein [Mycena venus]
MDVDPPAESSKRPTRTATKKRKADSDADGSSAPKKPKTTKKLKGRQGRLAGLLSISLDVVFEILGHLHPLDVLRLSRTSKEFRELLMHKSSRPIWRSSLNNVQDMPPCPPNMTEPQWISLAFDSICQVCHKIARKVDWSLYIRVCSKCVKTSLAHRIDICTKGPKGEPTVDVMQLIPTRRDPARPFSMIYFPPELENVKTAYNAIKDNEEKDKFVEERKELVKTLAAHTILCEAWAEGVADNRSAELADRREERYTAIVARLTALGWGVEIESIPPRDSLRSHKLVKLPNTLTNRTWNTIEPEMIKYMELMKTRRLAREHATLVVARMAIATKVFRTFKRSQLPWTDIMPGGPDFCEFPKIKDIIVQPSSVAVDEQTFEALLPDFPGMIATWRAGLVEQIITVYKRGHSDKGDLSDDTVQERLKLATSVFKCFSCGDENHNNQLFDTMSMIFGFEKKHSCQPLFYPNVLSHRCLTKTAEFSMALLFMGEVSKDCAWRSSPIKIDIPTAEIVEKVVRACGMDPETTTVEDMDAADARFACHACADRKATPHPAPEESASKDKGKGKAPAPVEELEPATIRAYDWRNAVRHHGEEHWRSPTAWYKLSDADAAAARALEAVAIEKSKNEDKANVRDRESIVSDSETNENEEDSSTAANQDQDEAMLAADATAVAHPGPPLPSQLPELAFSCAHCIDVQRAPSPMTLEDTLEHIRTLHDLLTAPALNEDYYRALAAPEIYSAKPFPAPELKDVMIPPKPDLPDPPRLPSFLDHYLYDSDNYDNSDEDDFGAWW